jgi:hypothetical protein
LPEGCSKNADFIADMKMDKLSWTYKGNQRILVVMKPADKEDAKDEAIKKEW